MEFFDKLSEMGIAFLQNIIIFAYIFKYRKLKRHELPNKTYQLSTFA